MLNENELNELYRYSLALCNHPDDAYDLLQQSLEKYLVAQPEKLSNKSAYLRKIIKNSFFDLCRRRKIVVLESIEEAPVDVASEVDMENLIVDQFEVEQLMNKLEVFEREVLFLSAVMGYSVAEIAQQLDLPRGTVLSRLHRTKKKAKRLLGSENNMIEGEKR